MNLLMITRKIDRDDWLAGHSYEWAKKISEELAVSSGRLVVICLEKGNTEGLEDAEVYSLGKESGASRMQRFWNFQKLARKLVWQVDGIFCHQNPEYSIAVSPWAFLFRKRIVSWYVHRSVTWKTQLMLFVSKVVLTASEESFRINSPKVRIVGHGINTAIFSPVVNRFRGPVFHIITIGRISPVKSIDIIIKAVEELVLRGAKNLCLDIIGAPGLPQQERYLGDLKRYVSHHQLESFVKFLPPVPHYRIHETYQRADLFINLSRTGSVDKAVLEAMACEVPVITSNEAFVTILNPFKDLCLTKPEAVELADKITRQADLSESARREMGAALRRIVLQNHSLDNLAQRILSSFQS